MDLSLFFSLSLAPVGYDYIGAGTLMVLLLRQGLDGFLLQFALVP